MELDGVIMEKLAESLVEEHYSLLASLVSIREQHNLTQATVAERMGVSQPTVAAFERYDANPKLSTIRRYALAVGASLHTDIVDECSAHNEPVFRELVGGAWTRSDSLTWGPWGSGTRQVLTHA